MSYSVGVGVIVGSSSSGVGVAVGSSSSSGVGVIVALGFAVAVGSFSSGVIEAEGVASSAGDGFGETKITLTPEFSGIGETIFLPLNTKTGKPIKKPTSKVPIAIVISCFFSIN